MTILEPGRVVMKIAGREAGRYCVVIESQNTSFVLVTGPKTITRIKRRKCNVLHLEPTEYKLDIGSGADLEIENAWKNSGLIEKLNIKLPKFKETKEESKK